MTSTQSDAATVCGLLDSAARHAPARDWIRSDAGRLSYGDGLRMADALAQRLKPRIAGQVVALRLPNSIAFLIAYHAVLRAGGTPALLNPALPADGFQRLAEALAPALILADGPQGAWACEVVSDADCLSQAAALSGTPLPAPSPAQPEAVAAILFSGGTTGVPKRIPHTHRALMAGIARMDWGWPSRTGDVWLPVAPFTHIYGYYMGATVPMLRAGTVVLPGAFRPDRVVDLLRSERVTLFGGGPPAIYQALMASDRFADAAFPHLRVCPGGGAPFPLDVHRRWADATGLRIHEGYGMTEIAPISVNNHVSGVKPGSAGKAVPDTDIRIADLADPACTAGPGEAGEILVRGPHMMTGYDDNPQETAATLFDGWVRTGDIGTLDADGFLTLTDRKKDVIFHKGYSVFPREVEESLLTHPAVAQACVVGRPDDRAGERVVAFVALREDAETAAIAAHCAARLEPYKCPEAVVITPDLPLTPAGKLDRMTLRDRARKGAAQVKS